MAKKKSAKKAALRFQGRLDEVEDFLKNFTSSGPSDRDLSWAYDLAVIRAYREFETFVLDCLVCAINNDTKQLSEKKGFDFPKHLTDEVCEYIIVGEKYFDFRGRSGLISTAKSYLAEDHYFIKVCKDAKYKDALDQLIALRNFAAHNSAKSKDSALKATNLERMSSAGSYLKTQQRWKRISDKLKALAQDVHDDAPY